MLGCGPPKRVGDFVNGDLCPPVDALGAMVEPLEHDVNTATLAFSRPDRAEFFRVFDACYDHGVQAKVHRDHADSVLTSEFGDGPIVDVDLEPGD